MVTVRVLKGFYDVVEGVNREPSTEFEAAPKRAAEIEARIPGYVEVVRKTTKVAAKGEEG